MVERVNSVVLVHVCCSPCTLSGKLYGYVAKLCSFQNFHTMHKIEHARTHTHKLRAQAASSCLHCYGTPKTHDAEIRTATRARRVLCCAFILNRTTAIIACCGVPTDNKVIFDGFILKI